MRRCLSGFVLAALLVVAGACKEDGTVRVRSLTFAGTQAVDASKLADSLATRQSSKLPWGKKAFFDRTRFDADLQRIKAFYADRGYPDARVTNFDVKLNDAQDAVDLTVTVEEGEPVRVAALRFVGFDDVPADRLEAFQKTLPLKVGQPRDRQLVITVHDLALNELREHGFPYAMVDTVENDGQAGKSATLTFTATSGALAHIGPIQIQGNKSVGVGVIERSLTFKPGDLYQRSVLQDAQRRLYGMELFQFVNVEPLNAEQPVEVPVRVTVAEGSHRRLTFGVGYGVDEKGRVDAEYRNVNFLGGARSAGAHVRWSSLDRGLRLNFNQPAFLDPHISLSGTAQQWYTYAPAYNTTVSGGNMALTYRTSRRMSWAVSMTSERDTSSISQDALNDPSLRDDLIALGLDPTTGEQSGRVNAIGFDLQRSTSDSVLDARRGYEASAHAEWGGGPLGGDFNYTVLFLDGRAYRTVGNSVFASRLQVGNIRPVDDDPANVPFAKKYFLGGPTTLRGWGRFEVSPLSESGLPLGGNSLLELNEELRVPIRGSLGAVVFLDAGNVWTDSWGIKLNDLRYAIGAGVRYQTPVGPLRFDYGYQLNPIPNLIVNGEPETRHWRVHFSIGQAF